MITPPSTSIQIPHNNGMGLAKHSVSLFGAAGVTVGLIFVMTQLINNDMPLLEKEKTLPKINFTPKAIDRPAEVITIEKLDFTPPPEVAKQDYTSHIPLDNIASGVGSDPIEFVLSDDLSFGLPGGTALVPISPQFPDRAARLGVCGHVIVQYDISANGLPVNVSVLETSHSMFNRNAVRAVERSRYKPLVDGGVPTMIYGKQDKITFTLEGGC